MKKTNTQKMYPINKDFIGDSLDQYFKDLENYTIPSDSEARELIKRAQNGDQYAWDMIILRNQRLIVDIAKHYVNTENKIEDLIQEGNIGMMTAIRKYDLSKDTKLSTYATFWIKQTISRSVLNKSRTVRVPAYMGNCINKIHKVTTEYQSKYGRTPTVKEIAEISGYKECEIVKAFKHDNSVTSLDSMVFPSKKFTDAPHTLSEVIEDKSANVENIVINQQVSLELDRQMCRILNDREQNVLKMRFGIGQDTHTLAEIGEIYGVSREYIRKIEEKALQKLGHNRSIKELAYA